MIAIVTAQEIRALLGDRAVHLPRVEVEMPAPRRSRQARVAWGGQVVTIGGVHGVVVGMEDKTVLVQIADNVKVKYEKSAIQSINRGSDSVGKTS